MAAPTVTNPGTPTGYRLKDGFSSRITFSLKPNIAMWPVTVKPSAFDGGEPIEQSTMLNTKYHTSRARVLVKVGEMSFTAAYDPDTIADIISILNDDAGSITELFPTGDAMAAWGYLQKVEFEALKEGERPMLTATIAVTNWDATDGVEAGPNYVAASGT